MSLFIKIKRKGPLVIPDAAGYVPPNPEDPSSISLSGLWMTQAVKLMALVNVVDPNINEPSKLELCGQGLIPGFKFYFSDGAHIKKEEAARIAEGLSRLDEAAIAKFAAGKKPPITLKNVNQLLVMWTAFNRVAAANNGYTVR